MRAQRWTVADLEVFPDDGKRREIIDGDLYVSTQPDWYHQLLCVRLGASLLTWDSLVGLGVTNQSPGIIFATDNAVAPDLIWISKDRLASALDNRGHLSLAPELVIEMLSPGPENVRRDQDVKLGLYSRQGVREYWIVDGRRHSVDVYRRDEDALRLVGTLVDGDALTSPLLPGFRLPLETLFAGIPRA